MKHSTIALGVMFALAAGAASAPTTAAPTKAAKTVPAVPAASAIFTGDTVAVGVAFTWGKGVLTFKGQTYPFEVDGLSAVGAGATKISGTGEIYHLKSVADFPGIYAVAGGSGAIGKSGRGSATLKNDKGVVIEFKARETGLEVSLAAGGVKIAMTPKK
jgi:hypothetical protein